MYTFPPQNMEVLVVGKRSAVSRGENHLPKTNPLLHFYACLALLYVVCVVLYRSLAILSDLKKHTHPPKPLFWGTVPPTSRNPRETCLKAYMLLPPGKMTPSIRLRCFTAKPQSFCFKTFRVCLDVPLEVRING